MTSEFIRLILGSAVGFTVGVSTVLELYASFLGGFIVTALTIIFLIFQIRKIHLEIKIRKEDLRQNGKQDDK